MAIQGALAEGAIAAEQGAELLEGARIGASGSSPVPAVVDVAEG